MSRLREIIYSLIANVWILAVIGWGVVLYGKVFNFIDGPMAVSLDNISLYIISILFILIMIGHIVLAEKSGKISYIMLEGYDLGFPLGTIDENKDSDRFWGTIKGWLVLIALYVVGIILLFILR